MPSERASTTSSESRRFKDPPPNDRLSEFRRRGFQAIAATLISPGRHSSAPNSPPYITIPRIAPTQLFSRPSPQSHIPIMPIRPAKSVKRTFYIGHTESVIKRIFEHNSNRTPSIKNCGPGNCSIRKLSRRAAKRRPVSATSRGRRIGRSLKS